uniref:UNC93-like protein MFSD11 n=1 Tax=Caenorhabditis japonica TaxID=281687 RepID=A0A8R1IPA0_CAEJA
MLLGLGYALYYQGHGGYLTSHSSRKTIETNINIAWSVGCCCLLLSSGILASVTSMTAVSHNGEERQFSDTEIKMLFGAFLGASVLGVVNFVAIPGKDVTNCIQATKKVGSFLESFKQTCSALVSTSMLQLFPLFSVLGISSSFWLSIFPTALNFSIHNSQFVYLAAIYPLGIGIGEVFMGLLIAQLSRRIKDFSLQPTMTIGTIFSVLALVLVQLSTPWDAPMRPTREEPMVVYHSYVTG